jgi:hypothetical protein
LDEEKRGSEWGRGGGIGEHGEGKSRGREREENEETAAIRTDI